MFEPKRFYIAGVQFHDMKRAIRHLSEGQSLQLVLEPTNKYDPNAVRIEHSEHDESFMLGYAPKKLSSEIAAMIEMGKHLECKIVELNPNEKPWNQCKVEIREVEDYV